TVPLPQRKRRAIWGWLCPSADQSTSLARATRACGRVREPAKLRSWVCSSLVKVRAGLGRPVIMPAAYLKPFTYDSYLWDTTLDIRLHTQIQVRRGSKKLPSPQR